MNILVLCTGNACRSQMAEGFLRKYLPSCKVFSAGIEAHGLNSRAVSVMKEVGLDISQHTSKTIDQLPPVSMDFVLTVCDNAQEHCPIYPVLTRKAHRSFSDPARIIGTEEEIMQAFRTCRDEINTYCEELATNLTS